MTAKIRCNSPAQTCRWLHLQRFFARRIASTVQHEAAALRARASSRRRVSYLVGIRDCHLNKYNARYNLAPCPQPTHSTLRCDAAHEQAAPAGRCAHVSNATICMRICAPQRAAVCLAWTHAHPALVFNGAPEYAIGAGSCVCGGTSAAMRPVQVRDRCYSSTATASRKKYCAPQVSETS